MRGPRDLDSWCRHTLKISNSLPSAKRYVSSRQYEPYILPRLVIDLDAYDSRYVRKVEDLEPHIPDKNSSKHGALERNFHKDKKSWRRIQIIPGDNEGPFNTRTTTSPDILRYALQGDPFTPGSFQKLSALRGVFEERQIHPLDSSETKIQQLVSGFTANDASDLYSAGFGRLDEESIKLQIQSCTSFNNLRRIISMLSSTVEGCRFLVTNGASVVEGIKSCRKAQGRPQKLEESDPRPTIQDIIKLLNNLRLNMEAKGLEIGPDICNAGLYYSAKGFQLQSTKTYLETMVERLYATNWHTHWALIYLTLNMSRPRSFHTGRNKLAFDIDRRQAVLNLVTGWECDGIPRPGEQRKPSFASLLAQDHNDNISLNLYPAYVIGLGQMGESKALWNEYKSLDDTLLPKALSGEQNSTSRACLFAMGFILANNPEHAGVVLRSDFIQAGQGRETHVMRHVLLNYYRSHGLQVGANLELEIKSFLGRDWQHALDLIKRLALYKRKNATLSKLALRTVDWVKHTDGTGRAVMKKELPIVRRVWDDGSLHPSSESSILEERIFVPF